MIVILKIVISSPYLDLNVEIKLAYHIIYQQN